MEELQDLLKILKAVYYCPSCMLDREEALNKIMIAYKAYLEKK